MYKIHEFFNQEKTESLFFMQRKSRSSSPPWPVILQKNYKRLQCNLCKSILTGQCATAPYFHFQSRGNLTVPANAMVECICSAFTLLDYYGQFIA